MSKTCLFLLAAIAWVVSAPAKELLEIKGDYLLYSYDYNYIFGQGNVQIKSKDFSIQGASLAVDMASRLALISRDCRVQFEKQNQTADVVQIDLNDLSLTLTAYKERIVSWNVPARETDAKTGAAPAKKMVLRDYESLKKSLLYFLNTRIVITNQYRLYGYKTTVFIEGMQSVAFKKFKMDPGVDDQSERGFAIDKVWYYASQGLVINSRLLMEKAVKNGLLKSVSKFDVKYDVFGSVVAGSRGKINFVSANSLPLDKKNGLDLNVNYLTDNMFNASLDFRTRWSPSFHTDCMVEYSRTASRREELWLRLRSGLQSKLPGNFTINLAYEKEKQYLAEVAWQNQALKNFNISMRHSRSRLLYNQDQFNRLSSSAFSLTYSNKLFNLAADYTFHKDLLLNQSQGNPQLRLSASPFRLYHNLLTVNLASNFILNQLWRNGVRENLGSVNVGLNLQSDTIQIGRGPAFSLALAAEQLIDKEPANNATSLGYVFRLTQNLADFAEFDFLYNYHTRRKTEKWFIQGSTSQDWAAVLRLKEKKDRIKGWISLSFDTKTGSFTSGFLDCSVAIIKNWELQTQMNYDFLFKNFNYDFYLVRRAGRIMIRASYRSLSRQFLLEILPN